MKYGFEREFFIKNSKNFILAPHSLPHDDCGYLVESRGEPHSDPFKAAYMLLAEEAAIRRKMMKGLKLVLADQQELSSEFLREALRRFGKKSYPSERGNIYGLDFPADDRRALAGMHVHFSNEITTYVKDTQFTYRGFIDFPKVILYLDKVFKTEINAAGRIPGFYEVKHHGFEYRSLPATVDPLKVAEALSKFSW